MLRDLGIMQYDQRNSRISRVADYQSRRFQSRTDPLVARYEVFCGYVIPSLQAMHNLDIARSIHCVPLHNVNISCIFV